MARGTKAPTRKRILDAAQRLFEARGYNAAGIAEILRESEANAGSLYHYFSSKEQLLLAVLERHAEDLGDGLLGAAERESNTSSGRVFALFDVYRATLRRSRFRRGGPVGDLALEISKVSPKVRRRVAGYFDQWCDGVAGWLKDGDTRMSEADAARTARLLLSVVQGALMQARALRSLAPFNASVERLPLLMRDAHIGRGAIS
jgi:TetR/AcrR family transcriptional repressor of nem operon